MNLREISHHGMSRSSGLKNCAKGFMPYVPKVKDIAAMPAGSTINAIVHAHRNAGREP